MHIGFIPTCIDSPLKESLELWIQTITVDTSLTSNRLVSTNQIGDPSPTCDDDVIELLALIVLNS